MRNEHYKNLRIVFMGTPDFAVASLDALLRAGCNIIGVITGPDRPGGRGWELKQSAVKKYALKKNLTVLQPEKLKDAGFLKQLADLKADLQICVAFRMLPKEVWNMPPMGTINLHGSLLPQYRGAAPINWAIINGENETGVTTFKLKHEIDTGDLLLQKRISISEEETAGSLHDRMMNTGAGLLVTTVKELAAGTLQEIPQRISENEVLRRAPKIFTETCNINPHQSVTNIYNLVRGLSPYPAAFTFLNGKKLKIFSCNKLSEPLTTTPGTFRTDEKTYLHFACADGYLDILELQLEGKKRLPVSDFLRGYRF